MTRDGRGVRRLTRLSVYHPTWSPSGHTIALTSNLGAVPGTRIGVMSARGGGSIRWLPPKGKDSGEPDWSSTGQITFIQRTGYRDETLEVFVMSPDGTGRRRLTHNREQEATPAWSPDASRVAFHGERGIYVINTDGTGLKRITNGSEDWSPT